MWFGPGLVSLSLKENQLEELPDLSPLTGLQNLTLGNSPLMCDCKLLPFYRWLSNPSLKVGALCGYPSELRGQSLIKAGVFKNCSRENRREGKANGTDAGEETHIISLSNINDVTWAVTVLVFLGSTGGWV
ncbi:hypothetical protein E1301_Tti001617 [Triplophysa tibetana]|uniref:LRRCT domain-containing protein n=1 Tax=Triplophysa tibetana TaxID=1572043 RepID=A0A5A9P9T0_9TELE|nr:hypothetical protein E1301_Tti001617 [Triplophysa tibetana]